MRKVSTPSASRGRMRSRLRRSGCANFSACGAHGDMAWMAANADRRGDPRALWPQARSIVMLGLNYGPDDDPLAILKDRRRGDISVYARGDDYHDADQAAAEKSRALADRPCRRRHQSLCRYRAADGEAARRRGRPRLAGQAHQSGVAATRLVAVSRRHLHHARSAAGRAGARPLRQLPRLPRCLPDGGFPGAVSSRCAALHFLPHHRA